jgi:hypothetical protein
MQVSMTRSAQPRHLQRSGIVLVMRFCLGVAALARLTNDTPNLDGPLKLAVSGLLLGVVGGPLAVDLSSVGEVALTPLPAR